MHVGLWPEQKLSEPMGALETSLACLFGAYEISLNLLVLGGWRTEEKSRRKVLRIVYLELLEMQVPRKDPTEIGRFTAMTHQSNRVPNVHKIEIPTCIRCRLLIWGFKTLTALFGSPCNKDHGVLGSILGPPIYGSTHLCRVAEWVPGPGFL